MDPSAPTLRQLHAFVAVADARSFTRAAEILGVTQPVVSGLIRDLEAALGFRVVDRTTRCIEIAEAAVEFLEDARRLVREADEGVRRAREVAEGRRGRLIVGAPPLLSAALMPSVIRVFEQSAPEVKVELVDRAVPAIHSMVLSGDIGLGIGTFAEVDPGLCKVPLISDQISLLCRSDQPIASNERPTWRDLVGQPLLALRPGSGVREQVNRGFHLAGIEPFFTFEFDQLSTLLAFVEAGLGVTVLPVYALSFLPMGSLVAKPLHAPEMTRKIDIIYRLDRSLTPAAHEFVRLLRVSASALRRTEPVGAKSFVSVVATQHASHTQ